MGETAQKQTASGQAAQGRSRALLRALFWCYILLLLWLLFFRRAETALGAWDDYLEAGRINLTPFATVRRYLTALKNGRAQAVARINLLGNLALFMPMGLLLPQLYARFRSPWRFFLLMLALLPAVESMQFILRCGVCDVDDVILNFAGAALAFLPARLLPEPR